MIQFFVPGNPKGLKRHRTYTKGKGGRPLPFPRPVDASKTDKADFLAMAMKHRPPEPIQDPVALVIVCVFSRPKSHYRHNGELKLDAPKWYPSTPDWDNVGKFVGDALNGAFWRDDRLIVVGKVYAIYGTVPGVAICVRDPCFEDYDTAMWVTQKCARDQEGGEQQAETRRQMPLDVR